MKLDIAIWISIGTSLVAGFVGLRVAMRTRAGAAVNRDTAVLILFGVAAVLLLFFVVASALIAVSGMAAVGLLKAVLLLTAVFAVVGMGVGSRRGLLSGRTIKTPSA